MILFIKLRKFKTEIQFTNHLKKVEMFNQNFHLYIDHPVTKKVLASGPKRILALDGGGVRGALTVGFLERMEAILRERYKNEKLVLSDYFDLIGGTSTGAIIATLLAKGSPVSEIKELYLRLGKTIFSKKLNDWAISKTKYLLPAEYDESILEMELTDKLKGDKLGSAVLQTGLVIFAKRADTYSVYGFHNHPRNAYYESNKNILLSDLLRASSAAPSYFKPKEIVFDDGESGVFIDGGVSGVNNPSLMLFLMATIKGYGYQWQTGKDNLLLISVGTGYHRQKAIKEEKEKLLTRSTISWVPDIPDLFMVDAAEHNQMMLQYLSHAMLPDVINREAGDLSEDLLTSEPLLEYCRYNSLLEKNNLESLGKYFDDDKIGNLRKMEKGENVDELYEIGKLQAEKMISTSHFPPIFDYGMVEDDKCILSQKEAMEGFLPFLDALGNTYSKYQTVLARQAKEMEEITTFTSYGKETKNTAHPGDYIIMNQTNAKEQYVIQEDKFGPRYVFIQNVNGEWDSYRAIGKVIAIEITKNVLTKLKLPAHLEIIAAWNEYQYMSKGDFLVCPLDKSEVYRISRKEFFETYALESN